MLQDQLVMNDKDVVIFGSDQIWNFNYERIANRFALYTGEPFSNNRKIAYSASIGANVIPGALLDRFSDHLMDFHSVSVREEQAANMICELTGRKVPVTIDPILMLGAADWGRIEKKPRHVCTVYALLSRVCNAQGEAYFEQYFTIYRDEILMHKSEVLGSAQYSAKQKVATALLWMAPKAFVQISKRFL